MTANTNYTFTVSAIDAAGNESGQSNSVNFTTPSGTDTEAPSVPSSLATSNLTSSGVDLSWTASSDNVGVTGYNVYLDGVLNGSSSSASYAFTGLNASTSYTLGVAAYDAAGNESSTSSIAVTTNAVGGGSTTIFSHFFESGWDGWSDGGSDCYFLGRISAETDEYKASMFAEAVIPVLGIPLERGIPSSMVSEVLPDNEAADTIDMSDFGEDEDF